ncbi:MAG: FtsX-like permease family protein, partial [Bacteroidota bacterium]
ANTSMAMTVKRLKEIGIRKTLGSKSQQILVQFLFEMGVICFLAFLVAVSLANTTSRMVLGLFGSSFLLQDADLTGVILFTILFLLFTTLVAGLFPALYAWRFAPVAIMRRSVRLKGVSWLSKSLSVGQFAFSIAVLTAGVTFSQNKGWLDNMWFGYEQEGIYIVSLKDRSQFAPLKQRVDQLPGIQAAGTAHNIGRWSEGSPNTMRIDTTTHEVKQYLVGEQYMELMQVDIITGRGFINGSENDREHSALVNQEFARQYFDGNSPVNEIIWLGEKKRTIVGVTSNTIDDVYADSETTPIIFALGDDEQMSHLVMKAPPSQMARLETDLRAIWSELYDLPFEGRSQSSLAMGDAKRDSDNLQRIFLAMAILGGFLSLAGIFSLAKLNVARRLKEISIRKVLGASLRELLLSINRSFAMTIVVSFVVGSALGYFVSSTVLDLIYEHHVAVTPTISLINGLLIVLFSAMMIMSAVYVPARRNPVHGLRQE